MKQHIAVIGAGLSGLRTKLALARKGKKVPSHIWRLAPK